MNKLCDMILDNINDKRINISHHTSLPSTNVFLKELAINGAMEGTVVIADTQTMGRGRFNRKFYSPKNGIYMSILLHPDSLGFDATLITTAAAVAVAKATENLSGKETKIKWVNDVLINNKKFCGILTEGAINPITCKPDYVILGIGINAFEPENGFDPEIKDIATAVFATYSLDLKAKLIAETLNLFFEYYNSLTHKTFLNEYRKKSAVTGRKITVLKNGDSKKATAVSIDDNCKLLVEYDDKTQELLSSGEISIKL